MKLFSNIMYGIFLLVLILGVGVLVAPSLPYVGHVEVKIVKSGSMEPAINTGGIVVIRAASEYRVGDVVTFTSRTADIPTTHRIIGEEFVNGERMLVTKGDANEERDNDLVPVTNVIGRVLVDVPYVGFVLDFARQPLGFALLIGIPALLIILDEVEKIWIEARRRRRPKEVAAVIEPLVVLPYTPKKVRVMDMRIVDRGKKVAPREPVVFTMDRIPSPKGSVLTSSTVTIVFAFCMFGIGAMGTTLSYLSDIEFSKANLIDALGVGFEVSPTESAYAFLDRVLVQGGEHTLSLSFALESESVPLHYALSTAIATGTEELCNAIMAESSAPGASASGPVTVFELTNVDFGATWDVTFDAGEGAYIEGATCVMDLIFRAWDASIATPVSYLDEETVRVTFTGATGTPEITFAPLLLRSEGDVPPGETGTTTEATTTDGGGGGGGETPLPEEEEATGTTTEDTPATTTPDEGDGEGDGEGTPTEPTEPTEPVTEEETPLEPSGQEEPDAGSNGASTEEEEEETPVVEEPTPKEEPAPEPEPEPAPEPAPVEGGV